MIEKNVGNFLVNNSEDYVLWHIVQRHPTCVEFVAYVSAALKK